jgi:aspartate aminotransferase-like enzyme
MYFDFKDYVLNGKRGQTPFTPAVRVLIELNDMLHHIDEVSVAALVARTAGRAADFRHRIEALPVDIPPHPLSNACTPLILASGRAKEINAALIARGIYLNPNGGALADTVLRVGHLGNLSIEDNAELVSALAEVLA